MFAKCLEPLQAFMRCTAVQQCNRSCDRSFTSLWRLQCRREGVDHNLDLTCRKCFNFKQPNSCPSVVWNLLHASWWSWACTALESVETRRGSASFFFVEKFSFSSFIVCVRLNGRASMSRKIHQATLTLQIQSFPCRHDLAKLCSQSTRCTFHYETSPHSLSFFFSFPFSAWHRLAQCTSLQASSQKTWQCYQSLVGYHWGTGEKNCKCATLQS